MKKFYVSTCFFYNKKQAYFLQSFFNGAIALSIIVCFLCLPVTKLSGQTTAGLLADKLIFSSSSAGSVTYTPITTAGGATSWQAGATLNTNAVTAVTIGGGFAFSFDGNSYTAVGISNNGFITFGATAPTITTYNPIAAATGYAGAIAGYGINLVASTVSGAAPEIMYQLTGVAPNREFVVQFTDLARTGITTDRINFQIRLVETSNIIKIVFGTWAATSTTTTTSDFGQVGLRGESSADFHTRMVAPSTATNHTTWANSGGSGDIGATSIQTAADNTAGINCMRFNNAYMPSATSTLTYTWTPVASSFYQALPYTQNFDNWVNLQALKDVPASAGVITWPSSGHLSWRTITETVLNASWSGTTGNFTAPTTQAGAGSAVFNQYNATTGTKGVMDFFVNFSAAGNKVVDFYIRNPGTTSASDVLQVFLSTDGGVSFLQIGSDIAAPTPTTATAWSAKQTLALGSSTSSNCILRFQGVSDYGSSGENLAIDEMSVYVQAACTTPAAQPTLLNLTSVTSTTLSGAFTAVSPSPPSGYIVLRSTSSTAPTLVNGTPYTVGSAYTLPASSYTVISNGTSTSFSETALTANTQYYYYVFSYNSSCSGAPYYLGTSPLTANALTCTAAAATLTGVAAGSSSATISFATVTGAISYALQYTVAGANSWSTASPVPLASPYTLNGLAANTAYDIRLQGPNSSCGTLKTTSNAFTTTCLNYSLNVLQGFNATTIPTCWTQQNVVGTSAIQFVTSSSNPTTSPQEGTYHVFWNSLSYSNGNQTRLVSPPITTTGASNVNAKFYWDHDNSAYTTVGTYGDEGVKLQYSLDGTTWVTVQNVNRLLTGTDGWTLYDIPLPAAACNVPTVYVGFLFTSRYGDNCSMDNVLIYVPSPCTTPTAQPTALNLTNISATALNGAFTAASPAPGGYIVLRSTSATEPVLVNGTPYSVGSSYALPAGSYTVVTNGTSTSFSETAILANTQYYYYVFSYNGSCIGAPYYLNSSPLKDNVLTCTDQTASLTGVAASSTSATITFSAIPGAASYILQYSVAGAATWIAASPAPTASPYTLTGLTPGTAYDIRIKGPNANCGTNKKTASAFTTPCGIITSLPWSEKFDAMATIGAAILPSCWLNVTGSSSFTSANTASNSYHDPYSTPNYVTIYYGTTASYMWTPGFQLTAGVSYEFSFKWAGDTYSGWTGDAWVNTAQSSSGATALGAFVATGTTTTAAYTTKIYTYTPSVSGNYYFATRVLSNATPFYLGFDDYALRVAPPCNTGGTASAATTNICGVSGSTTLSAVDYAVNGGTITYQWEYSSSSTFASGGTNIPGATNPLSANTGTISATTYYRLRVNCSALPAVPGYSNIVTVTISNPQVLTTTPNTRCGIGTTTLQATTGVGYTLNWYTSSSGGTSLGTGTSFVTPEISATTNYYVGASNGVSTATIGATYTGSSNNSTNVGSHGIVINTSSSNINIVSAKIPFTGKGIFTIQLQTTAGVVVSTVNTPEVTGGGTTAVTVPIGMAIGTPGTYRLLVTGVTGTIDELGYISTASYPYTGLGGAFSVTAGYWYGNDANDNLYLFNLVVTNTCESARTSVTATVTAPPAIAVTPTTATICSGTSTTVNVTAGTVGNFSTYSWTPVAGSAAGGTPLGSSVTLNPTANTTYTVSGTSGSGCVNKATVVVTVNPAAPVTTGASICSGGSATTTISASSSCSNFANSGLTINGAWNAATDPIAIQPVIFLPNSPTCQFDADGNTMNYTKMDFQVSVSGSYTFTMPNTTAFDGMGYIVTGPFVPGICPGTGTWIVGDDDSGPTTFEPMMTANLTAGITYTLITTAYYPGSSTVTNSYMWNVTTGTGGQIMTGTAGTMQWWTTPSGGSLIGSGGSPFIPIGAANSPVATNTSTGSYTLYAACSNNSTCRTATPFVIGATGQWIGGTSTDWSNAANWCGGIPSSTTDGTIISGTPYKPTLAAGTGAVKNLTVNSGTTLTVANATMQIYGTITAAAGTINASAGTIELASSLVSPQSISGSSFTGRAIQNLKASNNVTVSTTAGDTLKITGALSFGASGKIFNSGDNVTLASGINGTGRVADITNGGINSGNSLTGKFVVERYIPAKRGWRLMTSPVSSSTLTINQAWQQGAGGTWSNDPRPGYGTHITGGTVRTTAQGYDQGPMNASIYGYSGTAWNYLPTTTSDSVNSRPGFMLFIRGSRAINLPASTPSTTADITVLNPAGALRFGTRPTLTAPVGGGFMVIGNPFASPINFNLISKAGVIGGVGGDAYYLWDPYLGGSFGVGAFVTFSWNGTSYDKNVVAGPGLSSITNTGVIPSSAAFMVNFNAGGSLTVEEADKTTDVLPLTNVFRPAYVMGKLRTTLHGFNADSSRFAIDGNLVTFSDYSVTALDNEDAIKPTNFGEDFAITREEKNIAIERRGWVTGEDTMFFNMRRMKQRKYELEIAAENLQLPNNMLMLLEDTYVHTKTPLSTSGSNRVQFDITVDAASASTDRFRIIYTIPGGGPLPVTFNTIRAWQQSSDIAVEWKVDNEINIVRYEVEKSSDGRHFTFANTTQAMGGSNTYNWLDVHAVSGDNFYRIKSVDNNGEIKYSRVVKVRMNAGKSSLAIYPNPVTDDIVNILFTNMAGGKYSIKISNAIGQVILVKQVNHAAGSSSEPIQVKTLAKGTYQMEILQPDGTKTGLSFIY